MSLAFLLSAAAASAVTALLFLLCCPGMLGILQQEGYSGGAFLRWLFRRHNMRLRRLELLSLSHVLLLTLCGLCFSFLAPEAVNAVCLLPLWGMCVLFAFSEKKYALKVPLARTPRMIRLIVCVFVLLYFAAFGAMVGLKAAALDEGALALNIAGSGPSVFALTADYAEACRVADRMKAHFAARNIGCRTYAGRVSNAGARVVG